MTLLPSEVRGASQPRATERAGQASSCIRPRVARAGPVDSRQAGAERREVDLRHPYGARPSRQPIIFMVPRMLLTASSRASDPGVGVLPSNCSDPAHIGLPLTERPHFCTALRDPWGARLRVLRDDGVVTDWTFEDGRFEWRAWELVRRPTAG